MFIGGNKYLRPIIPSVIIAIAIFYIIKIFPKITGNFQGETT